MNKLEIKNLLISMKNSENESKVNNFLGKIDLISDKELEAMISKIGNTEDSIKSYLQSKLENTKEEFTPINKMFSYGVNRKYYSFTFTS